ncbi:WhiB family transcriptional regulator [Amycolatopsis sp. VC5-11]|uniref:WhiB family transcriptional regulator n=1 Tax=Amycolatopsis sp. VC5-11 TaxID=3120156 RepID=UPI003008FD84
MSAARFRTAPRRETRRVQLLEWLAEADLVRPDAPVGGRCAETDSEIFFPEKGENPKAAQRTCRNCDLRAQCLSYALATEQEFGVWGGTTPNERAWLRQVREAQAVAA